MRARVVSHIFYNRKHVNVLQTVSISTIDFVTIVRNNSFKTLKVWNSSWVWSEKDFESVNLNWIHQRRVSFVFAFLPNDCRVVLSVKKKKKKTKKTVTWKTGLLSFLFFLNSRINVIWPFYSVVAKLSRYQMSQRKSNCLSPVVYCSLFSLVVTLKTKQQNQWKHLQDNIANQRIITDRV